MLEDCIIELGDGELNIYVIAEVQYKERLYILADELDESENITDIIRIYLVDIDKEDQPWVTAETNLDILKALDPIFFKRIRERI